MGMGDYISDCAEHDYAVLELSRKRDLARLKSKEQQEELVKFYREKDVNEEDAKVIVARVAKYPELFAEQLVKNVVGMQPPEEDGHRSSVLKGIITFVSFLIFGIVPLLPFILQSLIQDYIGFNPDSPLAVVCIASGMTMFVLGAIAGTVTEQNQLRSGMFLAAQGLLTAYAAYAVGKALESFQLSTSPGVHGSEL
jgi:VIT1/CCC1 family predicted Fe2+/Mn2+ transporter